MAQNALNLRLRLLDQELFERRRDLRQLARGQVHHEPVALDRVVRQRQHLQHTRVEFEHTGVQ